MTTNMNDAKLLELATDWAAAWSAPDSSTIIALLSEDIEQTDHAFLVTAYGHKGIDRHFAIWRHCMKDYKMTVIDSWPSRDYGDGRKGFSFRVEGTGVFANDLVKRKATGERFWYYAAVDFVVNADLKIEKINEWYSTDFAQIKDGRGEYREQRGQF